MTDELMPELDDESLDLWLSCLADRELHDSQRVELLRFLDQHPEHWRQCALALWDVQLLESCLPEALHECRRSTPVGSLPEQTQFAGQMCEGSISAEVVVATPVNNKRAGWQRYIHSSLGLSLTLAVLLGFATGWWGSWQRSSDVISILQADVQDTQRYVDVLEGTLRAEQATFRSLRGVFPDYPCLIEIESTADRVTYLADGHVSDDLLRGLVNLGQVHVRPYEPMVETPLWRSLDRPVVAIEVDKFPFLLAQGDFQ